MSSCVFNCLKITFGFWGAIAILGLLLVGLTALVVGSGGGAAAAIAAALETAIGASGAIIAGIGAVGLGGSLVGCISTCFVISP